VPASQPDTAVVWLPWERYRGWLAGKITTAETGWGGPVTLGQPWAPGEHWFLHGPTGEGKTTHAVGVLDLRKYVIALDPKGEDPTLAKAGYQRVRSMWRPGMRYRLEHRDDARVWQDAYKRMEAGKPARLIVGGPAGTDNEVAALKQLMTDAAKFVQYQGGWTFYVDELEIATSPELFNIRPIVNRMLIAARARGTSVLSGYQAQAWVTKHASRQARRGTMWPTGDRDMIKAVAQTLGRDWREISRCVDELPQFHTVTIPRGKRGGPLVITRAPRL
jgi:hypothetical protein